MRPRGPVYAYPPGPVPPTGVSMPSSSTYLPPPPGPPGMYLRFLYGGAESEMVRLSGRPELLTRGLGVPGSGAIGEECGSSQTSTKGALVGGKLRAPRAASLAGRGESSPGAQMRCRETAARSSAVHRNRQRRRPERCEERSAVPYHETWRLRTPACARWPKAASSRSTHWCGAGDAPPA